MRTMLDMGYATFCDLLLIDLSDIRWAHSVWGCDPCANRVEAQWWEAYRYLTSVIINQAAYRFEMVLFRSKGPVDCESLKNNVMLECKKMEEKLLNTWHAKVIHLLTNPETLKGIKPDKLDSFYNCVSTLISNQVWNMGQLCNSIVIMTV